MNANTIQAMLAVNAARITDIHEDIEYCLSNARDNTEAGEKAFAIYAYARADHARKRLTKAVALQRTMKTELIALHRVARIARKTKLLLATYGFVFVPRSGLTSVEIENDLDDVMGVLMPKKPDSRVA